ncbi:hypothetical protein A4X13_0g8723, partial [Tilletia indica]
TRLGPFMACVANCSGATLLSRHWTCSLRPQDASISTARMHVSHTFMHIASHLTDHPPTNDRLHCVALEIPARSRRSIFRLSRTPGKATYQVHLPTNA